MFLQGMALQPNFSLIFGTVRPFEGLLASFIQSNSSADALLVCWN